MLTAMREGLTLNNEGKGQEGVCCRAWSRLEQNGEEKNAVKRTTVTPISALIRSSTSSSSPIILPPQRWLKNSHFPNPTSTLSRLSYTPDPHADAHRTLAILALCVSQTDGEIPLLAVFSRDWNVDEGQTRMAFGWK